MYSVFPKGINITSISSDFTYAYHVSGNAWYMDGGTDDVTLRANFSYYSSQLTEDISNLFAMGTNISTDCPRGLSLRIDCCAILRDENNRDVRTSKSSFGYVDCILREDTLEIKDIKPTSFSLTYIEKTLGGTKSGFYLEWYIGTVSILGFE